jgi:hypothetical protein
MKTFTFKKLTAKAKKRAVKDYLDGWLETHSDDPLDYNESYDTLMFDLSDERYTKFGRLLE